MDRRGWGRFGDVVCYAGAGIVHGGFSRIVHSSFASDAAIL